MASERAAALADDFVAANAEVVAFARSCGEDEWALPVPGEEWTVGVVLHHIAEGTGTACAGWRRWPRGDGVAETAADIDRANAAHAVRPGRSGRPRPSPSSRRTAPGSKRVLRSLSDEELDRRRPSARPAGRIFPTVDLAAVAARHTREHLAHARAAGRHSS